MSKKTAIINSEKVEFSYKDKSPDKITIELNGKSFTFEKTSANPFVLKHNGKNYPCDVVQLGKGLSQVIGTKEAMIEIQSTSIGKRKDEGGSLKSPMPGKIFKVNVSEGQSVKKGDALMIVEAMKMEHAVRAPLNGKVKKIFFKAGDQVQGGVELLSLEEEKGV